MSLAAAEVGKLLAERRIGVVYGGASIGLMGALADAAQAAGGEVIGVIPRALVKWGWRTPGWRTSGSSPRCTSARL